MKRNIKTYYIALLILIAISLTACATMTVSGARAKRIEKFEFGYPPVKFTVNEQSAVCVTEKDWDRYNAYVRTLQNLCEE